MWDNLWFYYLNRIFTFLGVLDAVTFIVSLSILFYDRELINKKKINIKNALILFSEVAGMYAALLILGGLLRMISDNDIVLNYLPKLIVTVLYVCFFNSYKWQSKVILGSLIYALNHCIIEVIGCFSGMLDSRTSSMATLYIRSVMMLFIIGVAVLLRIYNIDKYRNITKSAVVEVAVFSCIGVMLAILRSVFIPYFSRFEQTEYYEYSFYAHLYIMIILICIIVFIFACYFFLVRNIKVNEENIDLTNKFNRLENIQELVAVNENNLRQLYKVKHEIKNRFSIMQDMLKNKEYKELEDYFKELNGETVVPLICVSTGNESFDRVLNLEISKAAAKNIQVASKLVVPPSLPFLDIDLSGLITNLMDNAIEACDKIEDAPRLIDVSAQVVHSYLILKISNSLSEENAKTALLLKTDKADRQFHGFGTEIIDDIVKKYDGHILRNLKDGMFVVDVMLDMGENRNEKS